MIDVDVELETRAESAFLICDRETVRLTDGRGRVAVAEGIDHLLLFGIIGAPGTDGDVTLSVRAPARLEIHDHPIHLRIGAGNSRTGGSRFFVVKAS